MRVDLLLLSVILHGLFGEWSYQTLLLLIVSITTILENIILRSDVLCSWSSISEGLCHLRRDLLLLLLLSSLLSSIIVASHPRGHLLCCSSRTTVLVSRYTTTRWWFTYFAWGVSSVPIRSLRILLRTTNFCGRIIAMSWISSGSLRSDCLLFLTAMRVHWGLYSVLFWVLYGSNHASLVFITVNCIDSFCNQHSPGGLRWGPSVVLICSYAVVATATAVHLRVGKLNSISSWIIWMPLVLQIVFIWAHRLLSLRNTIIHTLLLLFGMWL